MNGNSINEDEIVADKLIYFHRIAKSLSAKILKQNILWDYVWTTVLNTLDMDWPHHSPSYWLNLGFCLVWRFLADLRGVRHMKFCIHTTPVSIKKSRLSNIWMCPIRAGTVLSELRYISRAFYFNGYLLYLLRCEGPISWPCNQSWELGARPVH